MRWFVYILLSLPVAVVGLLGAGFIANAAVRWHRVSSFEGKSGFAVIGWAILGAVLAFVVSLVVMGVMGPSEGAGYAKALGTVIGLLAVLGAVVAAGSWWTADIEPEIDGRPLMLEVELKLPVTVTNRPATNEAKLRLNSLSGKRRRSYEEGKLFPANARREQGRWIVPGEVSLFTMRGKRAVDAELPGLDPNGFLVSLPARPGKEFLEWSDWLPRPPASMPPWPDTKTSYRFRVQKVPAPPPAPTAEEVKAQEAAEELARFQAVPDDAPIPAWFPYVRYGARDDRRKIAIGKMVKKPTFLEEMRELMLGEDVRSAEEALRLVEHLAEFPPALRESVRVAGESVAERIRKGNAITPEMDPSYEWAADISIRFNGWMVAVVTLREKTGEDYTPQMKRILELSRARPDSIVMRGDVCRVASYYMKEWAGLEPLPTDPKPR
jgi:hypothetical protein